MGNLTGRTPKKRRMTQCWSDLGEPERGNFCSCTGADELQPDEMPIDDEGGCDNATSLRKPLTTNQKVVQNIHNNCGHASKEEFSRALRLSRARPEVLDFLRREFECPACAAKGHPPKPGLPAAMPRTFRVNETFGVDLVEVECSDGTNIIFCNMVCWGTFVPIVHIYPGQNCRDSGEVHIRTMDQVFCPPILFIADQGTKFVGTQFKEFTIANSILLHIINV